MRVRSTYIHRLVLSAYAWQDELLSKPGGMRFSSKEASAHGASFEDPLLAFLCGRIRSHPAGAIFAVAVFARHCFFLLSTSAYIDEPPANRRAFVYEHCTWAIRRRKIITSVASTLSSCQGAGRGAFLTDK